MACQLPDCLVDGCDDGTATPKIRFFFSFLSVVILFLSNLTAIELEVVNNFRVNLAFNQFYCNSFPSDASVTYEFPSAFYAWATCRDLMDQCHTLNLSPRLLWSSLLYNFIIE